MNNKLISKKAEKNFCQMYDVFLDFIISSKDKKLEIVNLNLKYQPA